MFDDGGFKEENWESFYQLHGSSKKDSPRETGQFGMGSRSFYHYTDVIQVVSGDTYACKDPTRLCFPDRGWQEPGLDSGVFARKNPDECKPFIMPEFGCDMKSDFKGSIFRLPLRTEAQAATKKGFSNHEYSLGKAEKLFKTFIDQCKDGRVLLFLRSVVTVEVWQWEADAATPTRCAWCTNTSKEKLKKSTLDSLLETPAGDSYEALQKHLTRIDDEPTFWEVPSPLLQHSKSALYV